MRQSIIFTLALSLSTFFVSVAGAANHDQYEYDSAEDWFNIKILTPGNKYITKKKFLMDIKDGTIGFNRTGATKFKAYINGTAPEHSYLLTDNDEFVYLQQVGLESERYDLKYTPNLPETPYNLFDAWWGIVGGNLACHSLTKGFKYFPVGDGGYEIHWDTRETEGKDVIMRPVESKYM